MIDINKAGTFTLGTRTVRRMGYGAIQLAGKGIFGHLTRNSTFRTMDIKSILASTCAAAPKYLKPWMGRVFLAAFAARFL